MISRLERFEVVDSTQSVVRGWLDAGVPEVAVAVANRQTAGRGRLERRWIAPPGAALLLSVGFRPADLPAGHGWRLAATVSLAMLDAAEEVAGLREGSLRLKWPNDLVAVEASRDGSVRKVAGVLGEARLGSHGEVESAVIGIGMNVDWAEPDFPAELADTMSSLREIAHGRPVDRDALLDAFLSRVEPRYEALAVGRFDASGWSTRQITTGRNVEVALGSQGLGGLGLGVDPEAGSLRLRLADGSERSIDAGDVVRCSLA